MAREKSNPEVSFCHFGDTAGSAVPRFSWLWKLITWDGIMPVVVLSAPTVMRWVCPGNVGLREAAAVVLPIVAFFIRLFVGLRHIRRNRCGPRLRIVQQATLFFAAVLLVLVDCMLILAQDMPPGALFATTVDIIVWAVLAFVYVSLMAFSLYPGPERIAGDIDASSREY